MTGNAEGLDDEGKARLVRLGFVTLWLCLRLDMSAGLLLLLQDIHRLLLSHSEPFISPHSNDTPVPCLPHSPVLFHPCLQIPRD